MSIINKKVKLTLTQRKAVCQLMPTLYLRLFLISPGQRVVLFAHRELLAIHRRASERLAEVEDAMHRKLYSRVIEIFGKAIERAKGSESPAARR